MFSEAEERKSQLAMMIYNIQSFSNGGLAGNELSVRSKWLRKCRVIISE
jgi:hypothetical protein